MLEKSLNTARRAGETKKIDQDPRICASQKRMRLQILLIFAKFLCLFLIEGTNPDPAPEDWNLMVEKRLCSFDVDSFTVQYKMVHTSKETFWDR
jgi:hypothetical protein